MDIIPSFLTAEGAGDGDLLGHQRELFVDLLSQGLKLLVGQVTMEGNTIIRFVGEGFCTLGGHQLHEHLVLVFHLVAVVLGKLCKDFPRNFLLPLGRC